MTQQTFRIRTADPRFTVRDESGRAIVHGRETGRLTIAATGRTMVTFELDPRHPVPCDLLMETRSMFAPVEWVTESA